MSGENGHNKLNNWGRPVLIRDFQYQKTQGKPAVRIPRERKATFHVWGYARYPSNDGAPSMQTVAIVELEDGRITSKNPDFIVFLDKKGNELNRPNP